MGSIDDEMAKLDREAREKAAREGRERATRVQSATRAADEVNEKLRELADYLCQHVQPTAVELKGPFRKLVGPAKRMSPAGFVLYSNENTHQNVEISQSFQILTTDGRIWRYIGHFSKHLKPRPPEENYLDVAAIFNTGEWLDIRSYRFEQTRNLGLSVTTCGEDTTGDGRGTLIRVTPDRAIAAIARDLLGR